MVRKLYISLLMSSVSNSAISMRVPARPRWAEGLFWFVCALGMSAWASALAIDFLPHVKSWVALQTAVLKHSGAAALVFSLLILALVSIVASLFAFRSKSVPQPSASVLLITTCALRAIQILSENSASVADANILGGLFLAAAFLYFGPARLWWLVLMPLAALTAFAPLVWLEFFKGAGNKTLTQALIAPAGAFVLGSIIITVRDLRQRANQYSFELRQIRSRNQASLRELQAMESDMKALNTILAKRAEVLPDVPLNLSIETTEFNSSVAMTAASSFVDIDLAARQILEETRRLVEGRALNLTLTAPSAGSSLPIAVRGALPSVSTWMKSLVLHAIDAVGNSPKGVVRVNLRAAMTSISISVEDNGRGIGESAQSKHGRIDGRLLLTEIREEVEAIGGRFDVQARLGVGARVTIELPRVDAFANPPRPVGRFSVTSGSAPSMSNSPHA